MQPAKCDPRVPPRPHRLVLCVSYGACLSLAVREDWPGWSCAECGDFEPESMDEAELREQGHRCRALITILSCKPRYYSPQSLIALWANRDEEQKHEGSASPGGKREKAI